MKTISVLLALVGLTLASSSYSSSEYSSSDRSFVVGNEYRYRFDGQVSAGLSLPVLTQQAATRVQALVTIQPTSNDVIRMQMKNVRLGSMQSEFQPRQLQPFEHFDKVELDQEQQKMLEMPIQFSYRNGLVGEITFDSKEQSWSANMKKAVLNMLQVNIKKQGSQDKSEETENVNEYFVAVERTLEGECEVSYTKTSEDQEEVSQWTKSINFKKCSSRPSIHYGADHTSKCEECEQKSGEEMSSSTVMSFNVTGGIRGQESFLVHQVELKSQHLFGVISEKKQLLGSFTHNRLVLEYSGRVRDTQAIEEVRGGERRESLIYNPEMELAQERFAMTGDENVLKRLPIEWRSHKVEQVQKLLSQLLQNSKLSRNGGEDLEIPHIIARIVKVLRLSTKDEIKEIHNYVYNTLEEGRNDITRGYYIDSLALAGTKNTIEHLLEKINNKEIEQVKAARLFKSIAEVRVPSKEIAELIYNLCESNVVRQQPIVRQSCWLTYGSVVNGLCKQQTKRSELFSDKKSSEFSSSEKKCTKTMRSEFEKKIWDQYTSASTRYEKILALKTLSNAAVSTDAGLVEAVVADRKEETSVRQAAIESLRRIESSPRKIQNILLPIYMDNSEKPEVRMTALNQLLASEPEQMIVDQVINEMKKTKCDQIRAFTYSLLKTISESENICEKKISSRVARSLATVEEPEEYERLLTSSYSTSEYYSQQYQSGLTLNWASLFSNDSVLPKEVVASLSTVFGGEWNKQLASIGFTQQNFDQFIPKILHQIEEQGIEKLIIRGKRSSASFPRPAELLRTLYEKMRIIRRSMSSTNEADNEPQGMMYIRYKNMEYAFIPFDEQTLPEIIKSAVSPQGELDISEIERLLLAKEHSVSMKMAAFLHEKTRVIPTPLGLPISLTAKMPTTIDVTGSILVELEPKNGEKFDGIRLRMKMQPKIATSHVTKMEIVSPYVSTGIKLVHSARVHLPIDTEFELNWQDKVTLRTTVHSPEVSRHLLHIQSRPSTFVRQWKKDVRQYLEPVESTVFLPESIYPVSGINREYAMSNGRISVRGSIHRPLFSTPMMSSHMEYPESFLIGHNIMDVTIEPRDEEEGSKKTVFVAEVDIFQPIDTIEPPKNFEKFFDQKIQINENEELFETEDGEYKDEEEPKRRQSFQKYVKSYSSGEQLKGYKHEMKMTVEAGSRQVVLGQIVAKCEKNMRFCRTEMEIRHSPVRSSSSQKEQGEWELKATAQTLYPEMMSSMKEMLEQEHREFQGIVDVHWGRQGESKRNELKMKIQGEQSREQKEWMKKAAESRTSGPQNRLSEHEKLTEAMKLNQYKISAEYKLNNECRHQVEKMFSLFKAWNMWNIVSSASTHRQGQEGRLVAQITIEPVERRVANLTVETPMERLVLENVRLPFELPHINVHHLPTDYSSSSRRLSQSSSSSKTLRLLPIFSSPKKAECVVKSKEVQTFDNQYFKAPISSCYSVLAKDCSSEQPKFAVLMKKSPEGRKEEKKMKIISEENIIEMELVEEKEMKILVNGKSIRHEKDMEQYGIEKINQQLYKIDIEHVIVRFDGYQANIKISPLFKNRQCGICGHYDGEKENDFRGADNEETSDIQKFHTSFLSEDEECEKRSDEYENKKNYRVISKETSSSEEEDRENKETQEPEMRTKVIEQSSHVCFSTEHVPECRRGQEVKKISEKNVQFKCLRRSDNESLRLVRLVRTERRLSSEDLENLEVSKTLRKQIQVPSECEVY